MPLPPASLFAPMAAMTVSVGVPLLFLYLVRRLDLYASGGFHVVVACFAAGLVAFPLSFVVNSTVLQALVAHAGLAAATSVVLVRVVVAPLVEEIAKSTGVVHYARRPDFTYFVDGAVYGFAAGTAFAIVENLAFVRGADPAASLGLGVNRALSTSLMHGSASALVGVALGRFRFSSGAARLGSLLFGWGVAIALHASFNGLLAASPGGRVAAAQAIAVGACGLAATALLIGLGLREERQWLRDSLDDASGVTPGEAEAVDRMRDLEALLEPVEARFGREKRRQVRDLLALQARYGIKRRASQLASDPAHAAELRRESAALRARMDDRRQRIGIYCMAYVRSVMPSKGAPIWSQLEAALAEGHEPAIDLWKEVERRSP